MISQDYIPFSLFLNYDSLFSGIVFLYFNSEIKSKSKQEIKYSIKIGLFFAIASVLILITLSLLLSLVRWDFKFTHISIIFLLQNIIFTCFYEEIMWRGYIQNNLIQYSNNLLGITLTALIFGTVHIFFAGINFAILAFISGILYGTCYFYAGNKIEASIICHYIVNIVHFIFFTYPIIKTSL